MKMILLWTFATMLLHWTDGGRILIYPFGHCLNSHLLNAETLGEMVAQTGHNVDFLVSEAYKTFDHHGSKPFMQSPNVQILEFESPKNYKPICEYDTIEFMLYTPIKIRFNSMMHTMERYCDMLLSSQLLHVLKATNYDLLIVESLDPCSRILADYLDVPFIPLMTTGLGHLDSNPRPPSYIPSVISPYTPKMSFLQRLSNTIMKVMYETIPIVMGFEAPFEDLKKKYNLNTSLSIAGTYNRAAIKLINSDFAVDFPAPIEPDSVMVGGFGVRQPKPLPSELEEFMQSSGEHGVIVVSFGTLVKRYNMDWTNIFIKALSRLPQRVLWRYYGNVEAMLNRTVGASNIRLMKWLPQADLLAHPRTRLFITHCGLNGMFETTYNGVPVVAIPLSGDQMNNAAKMTDHLQMGVKLDIFNLNADILYHAVDTVLSKPTYKNNALVASSRLRDQPLSATDRVTYWVDYVIRHRGAPHLKSTAHNLTWYQYLSLDVITCLVCVISLIFSISCMILYKISVFVLDKFYLFSSMKYKMH